MLTKTELLDRFTSLAERYHLSTHDICEIVEAVNGVIREARLNANDFRELEFFEAMADADDITLEERANFLRQMNENLAALADIEPDPEREMAIRQEIENEQMQRIRAKARKLAERDYPDEIAGFMNGKGAS